jgi:hypothetical protein
MEYDMNEPIIRMIINGVVHTYMPREDITVYELAKIHQLISVSVVSPLMPEIRDAYVEKYGLLRHFDVSI